MKTTLSLNKESLPELISQLEKVNGFLVATIKNKDDRMEEFPMFYQLIQKLKENRDSIEM